jgi:glutamate/tyrosine decarboxylase-like PLP-dependent enzyme
VELTRGLRALKLWMSLQVHGVDTYGRLIAQNMAQAAHLEALIAASPRLELVAPRPTNVVCFRYGRPDLDDAELDAVNRRLMIELQESGRYIVSSTVLDGRYALRVAITNHRSQMADFTALAEDCVRFGDRLAPQA